MKIVERPWGSFKQFVKNKKCTVKIMEIKPKQELSLQYHKKRKEVWYFLTDGFVQLGIEKRKVKRGEIVKIGKWQAHRALAGKEKVVFLEISLGKFKESDEVRIDDKYGRVK